jgi:hypothetical protein
MTPTLERVMEIASRQTGVVAAKLGAHSAIDQDIRISGDDVTELTEALAAEFGDQVWQWPWQRFAHLGEGLSLWFPFVLTWQLLTWPIRGSFEYPTKLERLELGHIAKVIDAGHWLEP